MKYLFILSLSLMICSSLVAQKKYRVTYKDTTSYSLDNIKESGDTSGSDDPDKKFRILILQKLKEQGIEQNNDRIVTASEHRTVIKIPRETIEGNEVTFNGKSAIFDSLLLENGELYEDAPTKTGFSRTPVAVARKTFQLTGNSKNILSHHCQEYLSTDSLCRIWVAIDLPSSINPGVRTSNIKGAVLAFELKTEQTALHSVAVKID
jgi:hypothetical protein